MRIDRVRLKNFCGVAEAEVSFAQNGVTIVHGPNEAGKSTLMHGINVLFDHRDDSRKEEVRLTKPVTRDVGSEVEADVEIGDCRFTYFKRFHKDKETRLTIHTPQPENLSGREAHERVQQILSASVDTAMWRALRIMQGRNHEMPELLNQPALAQALDQAAGHVKSGEKEDALFEAARAEYGIYFTETGRERDDPLGNARRCCVDAGDKERELRQQLQAIESDVIRYAQLERSAATLKRNLAGLETAQQRAQADWDAASKLKARVDQAQTERQSAQHALETARSTVEQREELIRGAAAALEDVQAATRRHGESQEALESAALTLDRTRIERDRAVAATLQCDAEDALRCADHEFRVDAFELVRMKERLAHVNQADAAAAQASALIAATAITEKLRANIRKADVELKTAQGILDVASPQLTIKALKALPVSVNAGTHETIPAGEERTWSVAETLSASIADWVELRVAPGTSAEALRLRVGEALSALAGACAKGGVAGVEEAEAAWTALQDAKRTVAERDRVAREHLRDLTREALAELIRTAEAKVQAYPQKRSAPFDLPATAEEAKTLLEAARKKATAARKVLQQAESVHAPAQEHHGRCREIHAANAALLEQATNDHTRAAGRLEAERQRVGDEALREVLAAAEAAAQRALAGLAVSEQALGGIDPASVKEIRDTAESALKAAQAELETKERALLTLRAQLDILGEKDLGEALAEAERTAFEARDGFERLSRRAAAARLLYETLCGERDAMRRAYVAPLREGIERLGRHVFGPTLQVHVDENLRVASRTVDSTTVMLEQLSSGAREQMGLLVRLAAASIVSKHGGVPLVLDDALGSSDESRLEAMGAVLRIASRDVQTIILTCAPERYLHVGGTSVAM